VRGLSAPLYHERSSLSRPRMRIYSHQWKICLKMSKKSS
jgi:hypothetical protein